MKYKLFISDYDGTLGVAPKNDIATPVLSAINEFTKKGGIFTICSGREYRSIKKICDEQGLKGLVVSFQGATIHDLATGERIFDGGLDGESALECLNEVLEYGLEPIVYTPDKFYIEKDTPFTAGYEKAVGMKGDIENSVSVVKRLKKVCKLGWLGDDNAVNRAVVELNKKHDGVGVKYNSGAVGLLEAINPECSKGNAVRFLANYYNIPLEQVIAVGDSTNDIPLIDGEWHGVAVGDGRKELKAVAKEVTVPFNDHPVKVLLDKYCL